MRKFEFTYSVYTPGSVDGSKIMEVVTANDSSSARRMIEAKYPTPARVQIQYYKEIR